MPDTLIKICGINSKSGLDAAVAAGADYVGFVHYDPSPRHVSLLEARAMHDMLPPQVKSVLLLVNPDPQACAEALRAVQPDAVQFHGNESPQMCGVLKNALPIEIWKALGVKDEAGLANSRRFVGAVDRIIFDAPAGKLPGGNGLAVDWSLLSGFRHEADWSLAGGLTPDNVAEAIRQTGAPMVDTSSGVESAPGVKDPARIRAFIRAVRG